eukprot:11192911-Alexandrium_andersonii.AAC.1
MRGVPRSAARSSSKWNGPRGPSHHIRTAEERPLCAAGKLAAAAKNCGQRPCAPAVRNHCAAR